VWLVVWKGRLIVFWEELLNSGLTFRYLQVGRKKERMKDILFGCWSMEDKSNVMKNLLMSSDKPIFRHVRKIVKSDC
jgi:hypothetical protein